MSDTSAPERLQKILANAGLGSRRAMEELIRDGRIKVNGRVAQLGERAMGTDTITVDDRPIGAKRLSGEERYLIMYNKPEGEMVTRSDPEGRPTVFESLPRLQRGRWIAVGRLDINSAGLLLFTTDGELANRLMHPRHQIEREYAVRVMGEISAESIRSLVNGIELDDGQARFEDVVESGGEGVNRWFHVVIMEGRKREVRRMWEAIGATVSRLKRVRYGPVILDSKVRAGHWRELDTTERKAVLAMVGVKDDRPWGTFEKRAHKVATAKPARPPASPWRRGR